MTHQEKIIQHAERYASPRMPVLPTNGKVSIIKDWRNNAITDPLAVPEMFKNYPNANLAIVTGYGVFVVDVDGDAGLDSLKTLEAEHGKLPDTWTAITGNGTHYWFSTPVEIRNTACKLAPSIDIRGLGGYVVVPPSIHPETKTQYEWEISPTDQEPAPAPDWLISALLELAEKKTQAEPLGEPPNVSEVEEEADHYYQKACRKAPTEGRDNSGFWLACQLRDLGFDKEQCCNYMRIYHDTVKDCRPGKPYLQSDAFSSVDQAFNGTRRAPGLLSKPAPPTDWPEPQPITGKKPPEFPMVVFKRAPLVKELIETMAEITCTPVDYAANLVLGVVSAAVQGKMVGCVHDEWSEPLSLMIVIAGARGSGKSQIFRPLTDIIYQLDQKDAAQRLKNIARIKSEVMSLEQEKKAIVKRMQQEPSPEAIDALSDIELKLSQKTIPDTVSSILEDTTPEKAAMTADSNYSRLILASVEGVCLNSLKCKYRENEGESFLNLLLQGHAGDRFTQTRVGRAAIVIKKLAVSALLFVQPGPFRQTVLDNQYYEQRGLTARFLLSCPEFDPQSVKIDLTSEQRKTTPKVAMDDYRRKITELWNTSIRVEEDGLINYYQIRFSFQARQLLENFHNDHIRLMFGEIDTPPHMEETLVKARGTTVRLATILHCLEYGGNCLDHEVSGSALSDAMILLDYYMQSTDCLYTGATEEDQAMQRIVRWIKKERLSEISSKMMIDKFRYLPSDKENTLDKLEELGYIRKQSTPREGGGRPKISYLTNPFLLQ